MPRYVLGRAAVRRIHAAVEALFQRAKARFLGRPYGPKQVAFVVQAPPPPHAAPHLTAGGVFDHSSRIEGLEPNQELKEALERVAEGYLDAAQEGAKAAVVHSVQAFLTDAELKGVKTDVPTVLGGELAEVLGKVTANVRRIVETETGRVTNMGAIDVVQRVNAAAGVEDPVVVFLGPNDALCCDHCRDLYFLADGVTPRAWLMSELKVGYWRRGDPAPSVGPLHPHCRHRPTSLLPGYGFQGGRIVFVEPGFSEIARQRA